MGQKGQLAQGAPGQALGQLRQLEQLRFGAAVVFLVDDLFDWSLN